MFGKAEKRGNAKFSHKKYYPIRKLIFSPFGSFKMLKEKMHADMCIEYVGSVLKQGDLQPALVCSEEPFTVAAYSDEMDAVVMLEFPKELREQYGLHTGDRLVTSVGYLEGLDVSLAPDIFPGEGFTRNYAEFVPIVQLFLAADDEKVRARTGEFPEAHWQKVERLASAYAKEHPELMRDGFFYFK